MKTSIGFWDALFGKRVTMEIPMPGGGVRKIEVTKKWVEQMQREGRMKPASPTTVKVNILDPMGALSEDDFDEPEDFLNPLAEPTDGYRVEYWKVGEQVTQIQYVKFLDCETMELYALTVYEDGKPSTHLMSRRMWEQARDAIRDA